MQRDHVLKLVGPGATLGPIRATNDQIAADNTGHHRSGVHPVRIGMTSFLRRSVPVRGELSKPHQEAVDDDQDDEGGAKRAMAGGVQGQRGRAEDQQLYREPGPVQPAG
jgi:hypothetical protein